jgi:hypothetical protein
MKEHRRHKRFQVPKETFVALGPRFFKVGRLTDLTMDGLAFRYLGNAEPLEGSYVDIFTAEDDFCLGRLLIQFVSDVEVAKQTPSSRSVTLRQCHVKFKRLTPQQTAKLEEFIQNHTVGEA